MTNSPVQAMALAIICVACTGVLAIVQLYTMNLNNADSAYADVNKHLKKEGGLKKHSGPSAYQNAPKEISRDATIQDISISAAKKKLTVDLHSMEYSLW